MRIIPVCNRGASYVDLKTADDARHVDTNVSPAAVRTRNKNRRVFAMARRLISIRQLIQDLEEDGLDINQVFVDPEDVAEIPEAEEDN